MNPLTTPISDPDSVDAAIVNRQSVRAFLPTPVPRELIEHILRVASRAPSGSNAQPWKVYVLQGARRDELVRQVSDAHRLLREQPDMRGKFRTADNFDYYPRQWVEPYLSRRRENGWSLYGLLGIVKGDNERMFEQQHQNYSLFGAPVGLMFTLDRAMGYGSLLDCGMFMQNVMTAAHARGLHTCMQAAWAPFSGIVLPLVGAAAGEILVGGLALGHADPDAIVNTLRTPREPVDVFAKWLD